MRQFSTTFASKSSCCALQSCARRSFQTASVSRTASAVVAAPSGLLPSSPFSSGIGSFGSQKRHNTKYMMSNTKAAITPYKGWVSPNLTMRPSHACGGGRGVFAEKELTYDKPLMTVDAFSYHVSTEPFQMQSRQILRNVLTEFALADKDKRDWMRQMIFMMHVAGPPAFETEDDCQRFIRRTPGGPKLMIEGEIDAEEVQKLAMGIEYNRWPIEYGGEQGVALIPEIMIFNHSCEPNTKIEVKMDPKTKNFYAVARTTRPVVAGEELCINYMPEGREMPLTRFVQAMKNRWGFECRCPVCRTRTIAMCAVFLVLFIAPVLVPFLLAITDRIKKKHNY